MHRLRRIRYRIGAVTALFGVSMLVAACGDDSDAKDTTTTADGKRGVNINFDFQAHFVPSAGLNPGELVEVTITGATHKTLTGDLRTADARASG